MKYTPSELFDSLAANYSKVTSIEKNLSKRIEFYSQFVNTPGKAVDLGCGTGIDSLALTKLGCRVTGIDVSREMIKNAKILASQYGMDINFIESDFSQFDENNFSGTEYFVSMGNSLSFVNHDSISTLIKKIAKAGKPKSKFIIHILNLELLLPNGEYIAGSKQNEDFSITRKYITEGKRSYFVIEKHFKNGESEIDKAEVFIHSGNSLSQILKEEKFGNIKTFGTLDLKPFLKDKSKDLIIVAENLK